MIFLQSSCTTSLANHISTTLPRKKQCGSDQRTKPTINNTQLTYASYNTFDQCSPSVPSVFQFKNYINLRNVYDLSTLYVQKEKNK